MDYTTYHHSKRSYTDLTQSHKILLTLPLLSTIIFLKCPMISIITTNHQVLQTTKHDVPIQIFYKKI